MKLLIDMNLSPRWVGALASAGIDAAHWSSLGPATAPDSTIVEYAREHGYYLLTHDLDFSAILAATAGTAPASFSSGGSRSRPSRSARRSSTHCCRCRKISPTEPS